MGQAALLHDRFHYGGNDDRLETQGRDGCGLGFVLGVDYEGARELGVEFGYARGGGVVAELSEHFVGGAF